MKIVVLKDEPIKDVIMKLHDAVRELVKMEVEELEQPLKNVELNIGGSAFEIIFQTGESKEGEKGYQVLDEDDGHCD